MTPPEADPQHCGLRVLELVSAATELTIVAPFITAAGIRPILTALPQEAALEVYTRWRPDEVAAGVSDPHVFDLVDARGGTVSLHPIVHAKAYLTGSSALVGSANVTGNGLGWGRPGAVEILVATSPSDPAVAALISVLRATSSTATEADRDAVLAAAAALPPAPLRAAAEPVDRTDWLPSYRMPEVLWLVYSGQREKDLTDFVQPELQALGVPSGIDSEPAFNAYVGAILRQGFTGRIAQECSNLTTIKAVQRLTDLCTARGIAIDDPGVLWETLAAWIERFIPGFQRITGGTRLIR
ncbi:phospholipase D family protein [Dactylosporangium sp. CA-092794]|uniref:phospholipase D family protein n=1 Tax=Dactylosporangium sp. CA-092794 TaxID=3239929 RepID=UPI003D8E367D